MQNILYIKKLVFTGLFMITIISAFGQNTADSIEIRKRMGTVFLQNGRYLTPRQLLEITQSNTEASKEMKIAKNNYDIGTVFGCVGGFLVGWPIGTAIGGGEPEWALAGIGAGLIVLSIPLSIGYVKHAKNAVTTYNSGLKQTRLNIINPKFTLTCNRIVVKMTF